MTLFGLDISNHQSRDGFDAERARAEGFEFLTHKVSEGDWLDPYWSRERDESWPVFPGRFGGYVFCRTNVPAVDELAIAAAYARNALGVLPPLQLDYEDMINGGSIDDLWSRIVAAQAAGFQLLPIYLPRWYWRAQMGSPDLSDLPVPIWNSDYVPGAGYASSLYPGDDYKGWSPIGGADVAILQFSEAAAAAGENPCDVNAFRGTPAELDVLFGGASMVDDIPRAILEQEAGPDSTPDNPTGWPLWRYHLPPDMQPRQSQTDILRGLDQKICSELPAVGDLDNPRPKPLSTPDDLFGHVLSLRAQVGALVDVVAIAIDVLARINLSEAERAELSDAVERLSSGRA